MRKSIFTIGSVAAVIIGLHVIGYVVAVNSDAFEVAGNYLKSDPGIASRIGVVREVRLSPLNSEMRFTGYEGEARFIVTAVTDRAVRRVGVGLQKTDRGWHVKSADVLD